MGKLHWRGSKLDVFENILRPCGGKLDFFDCKLIMYATFAYVNLTTDDINLTYCVGKLDLCGRKLDVCGCKLDLCGGTLDGCGGKLDVVSTARSTCM